MELFFGVELPTHVKQSLASVSEEYLEDLRLWGKSTEEIVEHINSSCEEGLIYIVYQDNISLLFFDKTPYTVTLSILPGKGSRPNKAIRLLQETITMFKTKCDIHKLEVSTTCPDIWKLLAKCGFIQEGCLVDSRRVPSGEFVDEYIMGYLIDV